MIVRPAGSLFLMFMAVVSPLGAVEVIDPSEIQTGDTGLCITEVEGGELLEIPVRVLGVLGSSQPRGDLVIVRLEHPRFEETGVAAGMSGSPVYIGGRLLGALAYSWSFATEPIAGVTPFVHMEGLAEGEDRVQAGVGSRPDLVELAEAQRQARLPEFVLDWLLPEGVGGSRLLPVAIGSGGVVGALPQDGWPAMAWRRMGWAASPVGGARHDGIERGDLEPGAMVAGVLVSGDAFLAAGGTVTEVRDGSVWAFGHPFLGTGDIRMPLARASVVTILPSLANSFKMFNVGETIGTLRSDRTHGVWGRFGEAPALLPMKVSVGATNYSYGLIDHPMLTPLLAGFMVNASHAVHGRTLGLQTVDLQLQIDFSDGAVLHLDQIFQGADSVVQGAAWTTAVLGYLSASVFTSPRMDSLTVNVDAKNGLRGATIIDVVPERRKLAPGETLRLRVRLRREGGTIESLEIPIEVPINLGEGRLDVVVADGASWAVYDLGARPFRPASFSDELRLLGRLRSSGTLVAAFERAGTSVVLPGGTVAAPVGVVASLQAALGPNVTTAAYRVLGKVETETVGPVLGAARIKLDIRRRPGWTEEGS